MRSSINLCYGAHIDPDDRWKMASELRNGNPYWVDEKNLQAASSRPCRRTDVAVYAATFRERTSPHDGQKTNRATISVGCHHYYWTSVLNEKFCDKMFDVGYSDPTSFKDFDMLPSLKDNQEGIRLFRPWWPLTIIHEVSSRLTIGSVQTD